MGKYENPTCGTADRAVHNVDLGDTISFRIEDSIKKPLSYNEGNNVIEGYFSATPKTDDMLDRLYAKAGFDRPLEKERSATHKQPNIIDKGMDLSRLSRKQRRIFRNTDVDDNYEMQNKSSGSAMWNKHTEANTTCEATLASKQEEADALNSAKSIMK